MKDETSIAPLRELLRDELVRRQERRASYSLRAFSRQLKISPSFLSEIMTGRKIPSPKTSLRLRDELAKSAESRDLLTRTTTPISMTGFGTQNSAE